MSCFGYISDGINCAAHAMQARWRFSDWRWSNSHCKRIRSVQLYAFSLASLLFSALKESMSSQDLRPTRPTPLIRQKQRKRNFMLLVQRRVPERNLNVQSRVKIHVRIITISYKNYNLIAISSNTWAASAFGLRPWWTSPLTHRAVLSNRENLWSILTVGSIARLLSLMNIVLQ